MTTLALPATASPPDAYTTYAQRMVYTSIRVTTEVRDRLALIADQRGISLGKLLGELAEQTLTPAELRAREEAVREFFRVTYGHDLTDKELADADEWLDQL